MVIWGAGAIGGTIGAFLARAGQDVLFVDIDRGHVQEIKSGRLRIEGPIDNFTTGGDAAVPEDVKGTHELIILAVKAHHTEAAVRELAPHLAADGAVVSCQNGLNELVIAGLVGRSRTIGAFVNFMADYLEPGRILYGARGAVVVGELDGAPLPRTAALHRLLRVFEPAAIETDNIFGYLWGKEAYGTVLKVSAMADATIAGFIADPAWKTTIVALIQEVLEVARADGVRPLGFNGFDASAFARRDRAAIEASLQALIAYNSDTAKPYSGVWRDIVVRKRPTDVAAQLGPVQATARRHGVPTPLLDWIIATIAEVDAGSRTIGADLVNELRARAEAT
ncbi:MAG: ketopantoate reductase family protein [Acetobacteraceae bacterium]